MGILDLWALFVTNFASKLYENDLFDNETSKYEISEVSAFSGFISDESNLLWSKMWVKFACLDSLFKQVTFKAEEYSF